MSFCCLRTKLCVHVGGKYIYNDSMQCSYTVRCGVRFYAVLWFCLWEHNEEQNLCIWKVASVYTIVSPSPQRKTCLLALNEKVYQVICNFDTAWLQNCCWCGYWLKKVGWITYLILCLFALLNFSPCYILYVVHVRALSMALLLSHL
jgi:hypothetical protein